jgi:hypothetical protein
VPIMIDSKPNCNASGTMSVSAPIRTAMATTVGNALFSASFKAILTIDSAIASSCTTDHALGIVFMFRIKIIGWPTLGKRIEFFI